MKILLYRVGRNLNRVYRTAEAFGIAEILLLECPSAFLSGHLFKAKDRVSLVSIDEWPDPMGLLALETHYALPLWEVGWDQVEIMVVGGETSGLPRRLKAEQKARIPTLGQVSGLTVEAAVAIALYERSRCAAV